MKSAPHNPKADAGAPGTGSAMLLQVLTPRQHRALEALLDGPQTREQIDRITGASNGPDEVMTMRRRFGLQIPCTRKGGRDIDGHHVEVGIYRLADADQPIARRLLQEARA